MNRVWWSVYCWTKRCILLPPQSLSSTHEPNLCLYDTRCILSGDLRIWLSGARKVKCYIQYGSKIYTKPQFISCPKYHPFYFLKCGLIRILVNVNVENCNQQKPDQEITRLCINKTTTSTSFVLLVINAGFFLKWFSCQTFPNSLLSFGLLSL